MKRTLAASIVLAALSSATALVSADAATVNHAARPAKAGSYQVNATVNKSEPLLNSKVRIKATVRPAAPGAAVTLQVKYENRKSWKTIDHGRLNGLGKVVFNDKVGSVRERRYRVVKPAGPGHAAGQGTTPKVTVFGWRDLTSITPAAFPGITKVDEVKFNGVSFPNSLRAHSYYPPAKTIDYNLNRDCKSFRGTAGLDDSSPAAASAEVALATDGAMRYSGTFALTQSAPVAFSVENVFRLTIGASSANGGLGAVGTPQVLCSF